MEKKVKIAEIGPYPPPDTGWSVRIKHVKIALENEGYECVVLNTGKNRKIKSTEYIDVQNGLDFVLKLFLLKLNGYQFHIHTNAQAVKGPILCLAAHVVSLLFFHRSILTFHGGNKQLYFPEQNGGKMYLIIFLNFLISKKIICNDESIKQLISNYGIAVNKKKISPIQAFSKQYTQFNPVTMPDGLDAFLKQKKIFIFSYIALRNGFYLDTLAHFISQCDLDIGFVLTGCGKVEDDEVKSAYEILLEEEQQGKVFMIQSLSHDGFMTLAGKADIFLRTPNSDGVSASVLEALTLGTIVVASENNKRPESVITYIPDDAQDLKKKVMYVVDNFHKIKSGVKTPEIVDTVIDEISVLVGG